jgi:6-phosphogluconolactonase
MSAHWHKYPDANEAAKHCSAQVAGLLEEALSGERDATLAVSGGSTPKLLFAELAKVKLDWNRIQLFWVDERMVPVTSPDSNYKLAEEHLIQPAHIPHRNLHRIHGELAPDKAAKCYADEIREYFGLGDGEFPHFDVMHFGTGPDAHTASLFPGDPLIENREGIAAAVIAPKPPPSRLTLLPGVLLAARHSVFLVSGEDKADALFHVFHGPYEPAKYPAQMVSHHGRRVTWFLDEAAAQRLD